MNMWKKVIVQWLSCFKIGAPLRSITDIRCGEFVNGVLNLISSAESSNEDAFTHLVNYLRREYPECLFNLSDPSDNELVLLGSLLLFHATVHNPIESLQKTSDEILDGDTQRKVLLFLQNCLTYGQNISRIQLLSAVPKDQRDDSCPLDRTPGTPLSQMRCPSVKDSPLGEFFSSPIARQQGRAIDRRMREQLAVIQADLENEQSEKAELKIQLQLKDAQISALTAKLDAKCVMANQLQEVLLASELSGQEQSILQKQEREMSQKFRLEISELEKYISQQQDDIVNLNETKILLEQKVSDAEKMMNNWSERALICEETCSVLKRQVEEREKEAEELREMCAELQKDLGHISNAGLRTPTRLRFGSPISTPLPVTESLGQIVELQLIEKQKEVTDLHCDIERLEKKLAEEQDSFEEQLRTLNREKESALRMQRQLEASLSEHVKEVGALTEQLRQCKKESQCTQSEMTSLKLKHDELSLMMKDITSKRDAAISELNEANLQLKMEVSQLLVKLSTAEEERDDLCKAVDNRACDIVALKQERDDALSDLKVAKREREKMENQLADMTKKRDRLQSHIETANKEKDVLEDKVAELQHNMTALESQLANFNICDISYKEMEQKMLDLSQEKEKMASQIKVLTIYKDDLESQLEALTKQKEKTIAALCDEKFRWESECATLRKQKKCLEDDLSTLVRELNTVKESLECAVSEKDDFSYRLDIMRQQEEDLDMHLKELMSQKKSADRQLAKTLQEKNTAETALETASTQLSLALKEKEVLSVALNSKDLELQELSANCMVLSRKKEDLENELMSVKESSAQMESTLSLLNQDKVTLEARIISLEAELTTAQAKCEEQASLINDLNSEKEDTLEDVFSYVKRLHTANQENVTLEKNVERLTSENSALNTQVTELMRDKERLECAVMHLEADCQTCSGEVVKLENQLKALCIERDEGLSMLENLRRIISELECEVSSLRQQKDEAALCLEQLRKEAREQESALQDQLANQKKDVSEKQQYLEEEIGKLKEGYEMVNNDFEQRLLRMKEEMQSIVTERDRLISQVEHGLKSSEEAIRTKEEMQSLIDEKEKVIAQLEQRLRLWEEAIRAKEEMQSLIDEKEKVIAQLEQRLKSWEEAVRAKEEMQSLIDEKEKVIAQLKQHLKSSEDAVRAKEEMQSLIDEKEKVIAQLEQRLKSSEEAIRAKEEMQSLIDEKEKVIAQLEQRLKSWEEAVRAKEEMQSLIDGKEKVIAQLEQRLKSSEEAFSIVAVKLEPQDDLPLESKHSAAVLQTVKNLSSLHEDRLKETLVDMKKVLEEERNQFSRQVLEMREQAECLKEQAVELRQQLAAARGQSKLAQLQHDDRYWQLDRVKTQMCHQLDGLMSQKQDVEEHLSKLSKTLDDVGAASDALFCALPSHCEAVHEVTIMKKEIEKKLRAVDKKYADSLCGIITSAHDLLKWTEKETKQALKSSESGWNEKMFYAEKDNLIGVISSVSSVLTSLTRDVRSAMNSCTFLIERCESFMKAQTRESLKIKTSGLIETNQPVERNDYPERRRSLPNEATPVKTGAMQWKSELNLTDHNISHSNVDDTPWFGGAPSVDEGYNLLKSAHDTLQKQVMDLRAQLTEAQLAHMRRPQDDLEQTVAVLEAQIKELSNRPSLEHVARKTQELHSLYAVKVETMKSKMKRILDEEVEKLEQKREKGEQEIIAKYTKRINEFEEHVQQLSSQLWELGEKLLQEQQDRKKAEEQLSSLQERHRQLVTYPKQQSSSVECINLPPKETGCTNAKSYCEESRSRPQKQSQIKRMQTMVSKTQKQTTINETSDVDDTVVRQSTMMAPASMEVTGLAFPEEDEAGEMFNNDYLTDLKEGRCRAPLNSSRLSELQYRNSLCLPHLKSSYPAETQFVDPHTCREDEVKGFSHEDKNRRQRKDHGTTLYKKPGPPTPSKKGGRFSLQGKEDLNHGPLREHNESATTQGQGMLRVGKTTPSRLRALFTSSKVANAATIPVGKKDENSTPVTPSSNRLSIFRRKFGSSKENHNVSSGYSSFR